MTPKSLCIEDVVYREVVTSNGCHQLTVCSTDMLIGIRLFGPE